MDKLLQITLVPQGWCDQRVNSPNALVSPFLSLFCSCFLGFLLEIVYPVNEFYVAPVHLSNQGKVAPKYASVRFEFQFLPEIWFNYNKSCINKGEIEGQGSNQEFQKEIRISNNINNI